MSNERQIMQPRDMMPIKSTGVSTLLMFLLAATLIALAGCAGRPSAQDVERRIAADHQNLLKVVKIDLAYGSDSVAFTADVEWLEDVTVNRMGVLRLGRNDPVLRAMTPDTVQVVRRGEPLLSLGGKRSTFTRGQHERITGRYFFQAEGTGWKWLPGRQFD